MQVPRSADVLPEPGVMVTPSRWFALAGVTICGLVFVWAVAFRSANYSGMAGTAAEAARADALDEGLQRAATLALGDRRGTVIVMDPQTGRVRAVVNRELAFEESLPPGSTIKPFTALAALRSGVIQEDSRTLCREKYSHDQFHTTCAHPRDLPPLNSTDAIAYSCNYYFGKVGESLTETDFDATLDAFGFGKASGINAVREGRGLVRRNQWHTHNAMGEGDYLRATPIQLINAYSALVNGGHLFTPRIAHAAGFEPEVRANVAINAEHRHLILNGMRGAVRYGTAETATLYSLPIYIFGKTGTATEINGYRTQGWFLGFASEMPGNESAESELSPNRVKLAVLVFLPKAHGSDAAEAARPIFKEYSRAQAEIPNLNSESEISESKSQSEISDFRSQIQSPNHSAHSNSRSTDTAATGTPALGSPRFHSVSPAEVRIHLVRENSTRSMSVEDYVRGVVAAEGSTEREPEALKALAIASRTYALKNRGRHSRDGYDFCTTTHCQRYRPAGPDSEVSASLIEAAEATRGEVLLDGHNDPAEAYFSASCGGATANLTTLWGGTAPVYLKGVRDEYCPTEAHRDWTDVIPQTQLVKALQSDPRTDVGERLVNVKVLRSDSSGRAELMAIEGNRRVTVRGWDFKIIVGRALGWNLLKSSRFAVARSGTNFIFHGSGFGHGLGLCQEGAHVMAVRGASFREILSKYFPSTRIGIDTRPAVAADLFWGGAVAPAILNAPNAGRAVRQTLRSEDFRINYPGKIEQREIEVLLRFLQSSRRSLVTRVKAAGVRAQFPVLDIFINETTGDFVGRTGLPPWASAATRGTQVDIQPLATLKRRGILETTLAHELVHVMVDVVGNGRAPRWLTEGLAQNLAGEGRLVSRYEPRRRMTTAEIEKQLGYSMSMISAEDRRVVYAAAYGEVKRLIKSEGEPRVWQRVAKGS